MNTREPGTISESQSKVISAVIALIMTWIIRLIGRDQSGLKWDSHVLIVLARLCPSCLQGAVLPWQHQSPPTWCLLTTGRESGTLGWRTLTLSRRSNPWGLPGGFLGDELDLWPHPGWALIETQTVKYRITFWWNQPFLKAPPTVRLKHWGWNAFN